MSGLIKTRNHIKRRFGDIIMDFQSALSDTKGMEFPVGEDLSGNLVKADLMQINHLLVSGTTGSGKSVFVDSMLLALAAHNSPEQLRLVLCDTKWSEFSQYKYMGHLLFPVCITEKEICTILCGVLYEGMRRLQVFSEKRARNISSFNDNEWQNFRKEMPQIVIVVDDLSEILRLNEDISKTIKRMLSIGRSAGIHIVAVTQTPAVKWTKDVSNLFYAKITFLAEQSDVHFITGKKKMDPLSEIGDAWYCLPAQMYHVHAIKASYEDAQNILNSTSCEGSFSNEITENILRFIAPPPAASTPEDEEDELLLTAVEVILESGQASVSMLQRRMKLGYSRAMRLMDRMEELGYVGPFAGSRPREILITRAKWQEIQGNRNNYIEPTTIADASDCCDTAKNKFSDVAERVAKNDHSAEKSEEKPDENLEATHINDPSPTKKGKFRRKIVSGLIWIFVGLCGNLFVLPKLGFLGLIFDVLCFLIGIKKVVGSQKVCCPYCGKIHSISKNQHNFKCRSCRKRSVRAGNYLKPLP